MEEENEKKHRGWDSHSADAVAAVVLIAVFVSCCIFYIAGQ